jgi:hypothetical protein
MGAYEVLSALGIVQAYNKQEIGEYQAVRLLMLLQVTEEDAQMLIRPRPLATKIEINPTP